MVQNQTRLQVADNSGAKELYLITCLGGTNHKTANIGSIVVCSVKKALPSADTARQGKVVKAVIVRTKTGIKRPNGEHVKFSDNAAVIIKDDLTPLGTRIFGPVPRELKKWGFSKIASLAIEEL